MPGNCLGPERPGRPAARGAGPGPGRSPVSRGW